MLTGVFLWVWCNGNTTDSKPVNGGSIPSTYANLWAWRNGYAVDCKSMYTGSIPVVHSNFWLTFGITDVIMYIS